MINDTTYMVTKGMQKCTGVLTESGWVPKCYPDKFGGEFTHSVQGFAHGGFIERMFDNPLLGTFSILAFSTFAILGILLLIWSLAIKGYALWVAAQRREKWWFIALLIINTVGILEVAYLIFVAKKWRLGGSNAGGVKSMSSESEPVIKSEIDTKANENHSTSDVGEQKHEGHKNHNHNHTDQSHNNNQN